MKTPYYVTVTEQTIKNGYQHDKELAAKYLEVGKTYEIVEERVFDWHTNVWLREFPGLPFNSVHFELLEQKVSSPEDNKEQGEKTAEQWLEWLEPRCCFDGIQRDYVFFVLKEITRTPLP